MLSTVKDVDKVTPFIEGVTPHPWQHPSQTIEWKTTEDIMLTKKAVRRVTSAVKVTLAVLLTKTQAILTPTMRYICLGRHI